jgi:hypothetical protein
MLARRLLFFDHSDELIIVNIDSMKIETKTKLTLKPTESLSPCRFICHLGYKTLIGFYKYFGEDEMNRLSTYSILAISERNDKFVFSEISLPLELLRNKNGKNGKKCKLEFIKSSDERYSSSHLLVKCGDSGDGRDGKKIIIDFSPTVPVLKLLDDDDDSTIDIVTFNNHCKEKDDKEELDPPYSFPAPLTVIEQSVFESTFLDDKQLFLVFNCHNKSDCLTTLEVIRRQEKLSDSVISKSTFEHGSYIRHYIEFSFDETFFGVINEGSYTFFTLLLTDVNSCTDSSDDKKVKTELKNLGRLEEVDEYFNGICGLNLVSSLSNTLSDVLRATEIVGKFTGLPTDLAKLIVR